MTARAVLGTLGCLLGDGSWGGAGVAEGGMDVRSAGCQGSGWSWAARSLGPGEGPVCCGAQGRGGLPAQACQRPVPPGVLKVSPRGSLPDGAQSPCRPPGSRAAAP